MIIADPDYPAERRDADIRRVEKVLAWDADRSRHVIGSPLKSDSAFLDQPFTAQTIDALFDGLKPNELRRSQKTLDNAKSICKGIASRYVVVPTMLSTPLSNEAARALDLTTTKFEHFRLKRFMTFLSAHGISPWQMTEAVALAFREALSDVWHLTSADKAFQETCQTWNACARRNREFPQIRLTSHLKGPFQPSHDWSNTPELAAKIDAYLACGIQLRSGMSDLIEDARLDASLDFVDPLSPISVRNNKMALRMAIWVLHDGGVPYDQLVELRDICQPTRFHQVMTRFVAMAGGVVNRTVFIRAVYLMRLSRHPGVLSSDEIKCNEALMKKVGIKHKRFLKTHEDRDQALLDKLDDPNVMDALLALPSLTKAAVLKAKGPYTIKHAYAIQTALMLECWLCAPYRLWTFTNIMRDQLVSLRINGQERVVLRGPAKQRPGKHAPEHFLSEEAQDLARLYLQDFLPLILAKYKAPASRALFPGRGGRPKSTQCMHKQIVSYVRKHTSLDTFHPHAIRKIVPKITLDADPGALEVARRTGGWSSSAMLHRVYGQTVHRASQARYLDLLQSRRLSAIRGLGARRPKSLCKSTNPSKPKPSGGATNLKKPGGRG